MHDTTRRRFLTSSTALVGLPFLPSLRGTSVQAATAVTTVPKRMVFLSMGWGVTKESWYPDRSQQGSDYELSPALKPLRKHKDDLTVIQNLQHQFTNEAHWGSTFWLTGANRYAVPGQSFHNSISADQVAAAQFGQETRFSSIRLSGKKTDGHGPGLSLSWNKEGKPLSGLVTPVEAFHKLFSKDKVPMSQRQAMLQEKRSVLDAINGEAKSVSVGLNTSDANKLDEYFQSIRDIETRLSREEQWLHVPKKQPSEPIELPAGDLAGYEEVKVMYDLMVAAMQVDASRVFTYRMPVDSLIRSLGAKITGHNMSHYNNGDRQSVSETRDRTHAELLARFFDKLKASKEADGSSLFDNTVISFGSNISSMHNLTNCPTLIAGGGAGIRHGRHLVMDDPKTPLCNVWLSLLKGCGVNVDSHGDSTGVIKELFA